jgi:hypothetical protein
VNAVVGEKFLTHRIADGSLLRPIVRLPLHALKRHYGVPDHTHSPRYGRYCICRPEIHRVRKGRETSVARLHIPGLPGQIGGERKARPRCSELLPEPLGKSDD